MRKRRNIIAGTAALLTRGIVRLADAGTKVFTSSTQGLQDLYQEAKSEYDSERASVRTVGSPIVMSGDSPASGSPLIRTSTVPPVSQSAVTSMPLITEETTIGSSSVLETGARKRGRPKKVSLLQTAPDAAAQSTVILGADGKPARKKRSASPQETVASPPKPRGRPRRLAEDSPSSNVSSSQPAAQGGDSLRAATEPHSLSELDGTTEAPVIPDDLTPAGGISLEASGDAGNTAEQHPDFGSAGEAPVE